MTLYTTRSSDAKVSIVLIQGNLLIYHGSQSGKYPRDTESPPTLRIQERKVLPQSPGPKVRVKRRSFKVEGRLLSVGLSWKTKQI
jgi:hypothetical protein